MPALPMKKPDWQKIINASADPARVKAFFTSSVQAALRPQLEKFSPDSAQALAALLSGSQFLGELLLANPALLPVIEFEQLRFPRRTEGFRREVEGLIKL